MKNYILLIAVLLSNIGVSLGSDFKNNIDLMNSNIESFDNFKCKFKVVSLRPNAIPLEGFGDFTKLGPISKTKFVVDDNIDKLLKTPPTKTMKDRPGILMGESVPFSPYQEIRNANLILNNVNNNKYYNLSMISDDTRWPSNTPINMLSYGDKNNLDILLKNISIGDIKCVMEKAVLNGNDCNLARLTYSNGIKRNIYFDIKRGYLPIRIDWEGKTSKFYLEVEPKQYKNGAWFPNKISFYHNGNSRICEVVEFDDSPNFKLEDFYLEIQKDKKIFSTNIRGGTATINENRNINVEELDSIYKNLEDSFKNKQNVSRGKETIQSKDYTLCIVFGALGIISLIIWLWLRFK